MKNFNTLINELFVEHQLEINRYTGSLQNDVAVLLEQVANDINEKLGARNLTSYRKESLNKKINDLKEIIKDFYGKFSDQLNLELIDFADAETSWTIASINELAGGSLLRSVATKGVIAALLKERPFDGAVLDDWIKRQSQDAQFRITQALRIGITQSETNQQIVKRLIGEPDSAIEITKRNAQSLVRTAVMHISESARDATFKANSDIIKGYISIATLDSRTTLICAAYDGLKWSLDKKPIGHDKPFIPIPRHWGCRSVYAPFTKPFKEMGLPFDDFRPSIRSSIDGEIGADIKFNEFLKSKPREWIDEYLGKGRADLYLKNKLTLTQLLDQRGNPLTLKELKEKYRIK